MTERILDWDGNYNVRDLGGLPLRDGGTTRFGELIRSAAAYQFTADGWAAAHAYGVRTVIDLTNPDDVTADRSPRPADITTVKIPLDNYEDREFWDPLIANGHWGTAIYYRAFLDRYAATVGEVIRTIAGADAGGVLFHCGRGQDRTGLIALVLLSIAGVQVDAIVEDYELCASEDTVRRREAMGERDDRAVVQKILAEAGTTTRDSIIAALDGLDFLATGVDEGDLRKIRQRLT